MFDGQNLVVLDLETQRSARDCRHCGESEQQHFADGACAPWSGRKPSDSITQFWPIGWENHAALGLSIGCWWDYQDSRLHWFDLPTLATTMRQFVERQVTFVTFNGASFDLPLMATLLRVGVQEGPTPPMDLLALNECCDAWTALAASGYDLLATIWQADPERKFERGLNGLDAISQANGYGAKEMDGATAPRLWAQGRYADVIAYNVGDVLKTKALVEQVAATGVLLRGDGQPLALPPPLLSVRVGSHPTKEHS